MKKLCSFFVATFLSVLFCVPVFASDSGIYGFDYVCQNCNTAHSVAVYDVDGTHYLGCMDCLNLVLADIVYPLVPGHSEYCVFCPTVRVSLAEFTLLSCPVFSSLGTEQPIFSSLGVLPSVDDHYFYCLDCGLSTSYSVMSSGDAFPHLSDCVLCQAFTLNGAVILDSPPVVTPSVPSSFFSSITEVVTAAVNWITAFVLCIVTNPLLLVFVVSIFVILGLYLLKRSIRL